MWFIIKLISFLAFLVVLDAVLFQLLSSCSQLFSFILTMLVAHYILTASTES